MRWAGIDFGAKLSGKTAICFEKDGYLHMTIAEKGQDADTFCNEQLEAIKPDIIFIDAPLSLPGVYFGNGSDFFYRQCDRELQAMSPMFLGGLTARAMKLARDWREQNMQVIETYPKMVWNEITSRASKDDFQEVIQWITNYLKQNSLPALAAQPHNRHQTDALLAWIAGYRYLAGIALRVGLENEGQIVY